MDNKRANTQSSKSKEINLQDKEMGLHLLLSPKATVNVLSPSVHPDQTHLYPILAGSNWTCYITGDTVRLGRAPEHKTQNVTKEALDVDFCGNKQISRRHAEIKFNAKKNHWELRVYGRIGVKVNHTLITKKRRSVPLTSMAYLDIGGNGFVFVLPDNADGKLGERIDPQGESSTTAAAATSSSLDTTDQSLEKEHDDPLANIIADIFETKDDKDYQPTTQQLLKSVIQHCRKESLDQDHYTMENVLRALVLDSRFKVAQVSLALTAEEADKVKWYRDRPLTTASFDTVTASTDDWSDFGYDFGDSNDHPTGGETNEEVSTTTGTPSAAAMEPGSWTSSSSSILPSSDATSPLDNTPHTLPSATSPATDIHHLENTHHTLPPVPSPDIHQQSQDECPPFHDKVVEEAGAWGQLDAYHISSYAEHMVHSGYSRGVSLLAMYSSILATEEATHHHQPENTPALSPPALAPVSLYPPPPSDGPAFSHQKRKRSTAGHEDRNLWTRFRTTIFRAQP
ncbi:hypothetical protein [Absidia glauca]|uniref:FHA domain-containing protein n=1 Tax=Absidia glauca TaxID=4829 RepID=A0A168RU61_ABSGL|nr:hypothetical protein [Absidia glauca]